MADATLFSIQVFIQHSIFPVNFRECVFQPSQLEFCNRPFTLKTSRSKLNLYLKESTTVVPRDSQPLSKLFWQYVTVSI